MDTLEGNGRRGPTTSIREDAMKGYVSEQRQDMRKVSKAEQWGISQTRHVLQYDIRHPFGNARPMPSSQHGDGERLDIMPLGVNW